VSCGLRTLVDFTAEKPSDAMVELYSGEWSNNEVVYCLYGSAHQVFISRQNRKRRGADWGLCKPLKEAVRRRTAWDSHRDYEV